MKNIWTVIIIFAIGFLMVVGCSDPKARKTEAAKPDEKPVAVSADVLTADYEENELAADGKYKDKMLEVRGKISNIAETFGTISVQMEGDKIMPNVMCTFNDDQKDAVAKLKKGQTATLIGRCEGSTGGIYVGLNACRVQ